MSVPEPMPVHSRQSERLAHGLQLAIEQIAPTERRAVPRRENQPGRNGFGGLQRRENLGTLRAERNATFAPLAFRFVEMAFIHRLSDRKESLLQIKVLPAKCQQFSDSQSRHRQQTRDGAGRVSKFRNQVRNRFRVNGSPLLYGTLSRQPCLLDRVDGQEFIPYSGFDDGSEGGTDVFDRLPRKTALGLGCQKALNGVLGDQPKLSVSKYRVEVGVNHVVVELLA